MCELEMHHTHNPGTINHTEDAHAANRLFMPEPTTKYNAGIQNSRLIHRCCTSLDLEAAFKEIKISPNIENEVCEQCRSETCRAQHSHQGCRVHLHHQRLPILVTNQFPIWCQTNHCKNYILPPNHLLMKRQIEK